METKIKITPEIERTVDQLLEKFVGLHMEYIRSREERLNKLEHHNEFKKELSYAV